VEDGTVDDLLERLAPLPARELGFPTLAGYLTERHHERGWPRGEIARELRLEPTPSAIVRLMAAEGVAGNPHARRRRAPG